MRLKLFNMFEPDPSETTAQFEKRINLWLQKFQRHHRHRIVSQSVSQSGDTDSASVVVAIWYEKVPPKE